MKNKKSIAFQITTSTLLIFLLFLIPTIIIFGFTFSSETRKVVKTQTNEISRQIVYNFENYFNRMINISNALQTRLNNSNINSDLDDIKEYFTNIQSVSAEIIDISLFDINGASIISSELDDSNSSWFKDALDNPTIHIFSSPYVENGIYRMIISKVISINKRELEGVLKIEINFDNIALLTDKSNLGSDGRIVIIDSLYKIVYSAPPTLSSDTDILKDIILGSKTINMNGTLMNVVIETIVNTKWRIAIIINVQHIVETEQNFYRNIIILTLIVIIIGVFVLLNVSKSIASPIKHLEQAMSNFDYTKDYDFLETSKKNLEITSLTNSYSQMVSHIKELMEQIYIEQLEQRKSELKALQNQINPHFLYNTLDSIVFLIEEKDNEGASEMVIALSKLFRISISKGKNIISISDEIEHARNYLLIQSIRFKDAFSYEFDIDDSILEYQTMKLLLQPLIENCITHGLKDNEEKGIIKVSVKRDGNFIVFKVSDNGYGIKQEKIDELYKNLRDYSLVNGVGLKNTYQRLLIYYSGNANLVIESVVDVGTTISISIPVEEKNEKDNYS
jgi:two-component system sensor histidine kinase YesM